MQHRYLKVNLAAVLHKTAEAWFPPAFFNDGRSVDEFIFYFDNRLRGLPTALALYWCFRLWWLNLLPLIQFKSLRSLRKMNLHFRRDFLEGLPSAGVQHFTFYSRLSGIFMQYYLEKESAES